MDELAAEQKNGGTKLGRLFNNYIRQMHKDAFALVAEVSEGGKEREYRNRLMSECIQVCRIPTHLFSFIKYCEMVAAAHVPNVDETKAWKKAMREWRASKKVGVDA